MFAILLNKGMDPFYQNISSFPTAIYTFALAICTLYWLLAIIGIVDLELDILEFDGIESNASTAEALTGVMLRFGLNGVPVTLIISFLSLFGWLTSYYGVHYISPLLPQGIFYYIFGLIILLASFWFALLLTALVVKLLRPFFCKVEQQTSKSLLGKTAIVRTSKVTDSFGEVFLDDGGAGLILKVRAIDDQKFIKGDRVVLLEYVESRNIYRVILEQDFIS
jgi:hypothetical protein